MGRNTWRGTWQYHCGSVWGLGSLFLCTSVFKFHSNSWVWCPTPVILAVGEAEAGRCQVPDQP